MTPWQFKVCLEAHHDRKQAEHDNTVWKLWHGEALARMKKLPALKDFIRRKSAPAEAPRIDEGAILARLKAYQKRVETEQP